MCVAEMIAFIPMSEAHFQIVYDGEAVRNGDMDVRSLAPALLALGDLFQQANTIINENKAEVSVRVRAEFKPGSFQIDLALVHSLFESAKHLILSKEAADAQEMLKRVFFFVGIPGSGAAGLFKLIRFLKGRKPDGVTYIDNRVQIVVGAEVLLAHEDAYRMWLDEKIRRDVDGLVRPLESPGIDWVEARFDGERERILKPEMEIFVVPERQEAQPGEVPSVGGNPPRETLLRIVKLSFEPGQKWRFSDGAAVFNASIEDQNFTDRVQTRQEGFASGDVLQVMLNSTQAVTPAGKITAEYKVEKVLAHVPGAQQAPLFPVRQTEGPEGPKPDPQPPPPSQA